MINNIVLDSNAFFKSNTLVELIKDSNPYTTSSVIDQLKDQKTKSILESLPFKIEIREPSKEAVKFVRGFALLTGDSASLSDTDIGVIALSYDLVEKIGMKGKLNKEPKEFQLPEVQESESDYEDGEETKPSQIPETKAQEVPEPNTKDEEKPKESPQEIKQQQPTTVQQRTQQTQKQEISQPQQPSSASVQDDGWIQVKPKKKKIVKTKQSSFNDWITPENYNEKKAKGLLNIEERQISSIPQSDIPIWLITGDFAMQNVAMQIGIPTKASDGNQIFSLKRYVQMCYACGKTMKQNLDKITTCPKCGYNTLSKVAYTIDQSGNLILHKKKNWQPNKQVFQWKQKKMQEQAKHGKYQRKKKVKSAFD